MIEIKRGRRLPCLFYFNFADHTLEHEAFSSLGTQDACVVYLLTPAKTAI